MNCLSQDTNPVCPSKTFLKSAISFMNLTSVHFSELVVNRALEHKHHMRGHYARCHSVSTIPKVHFNEINVSLGVNQSISKMPYILGLLQTDYTVYIIGMSSLISRKPQRHSDSRSLTTTWDYSLLLFMIGKTQNPKLRPFSTYS